MDDTTMVGSSPTRVPKIQQVCVKINKELLGDSADSPKDKRSGGISKKSLSEEDKDELKKKKILNEELTKEVTSHKRSAAQYLQAIKILKSYSEEEKVESLIAKWRAICQAGMSYIMNSTMIKISRIGGFAELRRKELEAEKRRLEYQVDDTLHDQMTEFLESVEFQNLPEETQQEYRDRIEEKIKDAEAWKEKQFVRLDNQLQESSKQELTMEELSRRLKVEYELVFQV